MAASPIGSPTDAVGSARGGGGAVYRWLAHTGVKDSAVDRALRDTAFERTSALFVALLSTAMTGVLVVVLTHRAWPAAWFAVDAALVAVRYRLILVARARSNRDPARLLAWMMVAGIAWSLAFGVAAMLCVQSRFASLQVLAGANVAGAMGAISVRNASTPRYAAVAMACLCGPVVVGVWALREPGTMAVAALLPVLSAGLFKTLLRNHKIMVRLFDAEWKATRAARTDAVTGLSNRTLLAERLAELSRGALRARAFDRFSVLAVDLDRFKAVNDTHGHAAGDALLRAVAVRLRDATREVDVVARTGGDEFVILLTGTAEEGAALVGERIVESLGTAFEIGLGHPVSIGASVGGVTASTRCHDPAELLATADRALYRAKAAGRGRYVSNVVGDEGGGDADGPPGPPSAP